MNAFVDVDLVVTVAAIASSVAMQLSAVPTAIGWVQGKPIKEHPLQFVAMALDAVVGLGFSLSMGLFASIAVRVSGTVILGAVLAILVTHAQGDVKDSLMQWLGLAGIVAFVVGLGAMVAGDKTTAWLGIISVGLSIASTSSPLAGAVSFVVNAPCVCCGSAPWRGRYARQRVTSLCGIGRTAGHGATGEECLVIGAGDIGRNVGVECDLDLLGGWNRW
jgi:hypothetical protein